MNEKLIRELYVRYGKKIKNGYMSDRKRILREYNQQESKKITEYKLKHYISDNNLVSLLSGEVEEELPKGSLEINQDGSQKLLSYMKMTHDKAKSIEYVMESQGYPIEEYTMVTLVVNEWGSKTNGDNQSYQIKLTVKPKTIKDITPHDIVKLSNNFKFKMPMIKHEIKDTNKTCTVYIADDHVGQVGYDLEETKQWVQEIKEYIKQQNPERVNINFLGDVLHVDNISKTTDRGTQLETQGTAFDMVTLAFTHLCHIVNELSTVPTTVRWVQGNHSRLTEFTLMQWLETSFSHNTHIEFEVNEKRRKAYMTYEWLTGIFHGDMPKSNKGHWLSDEFAPLWGQSQYREQYEGHLHHRAITNYGSLAHNTMTTKAKQTDYEYGLGYDNHMPNVEVHTYHKGSRKKVIATF